MRCPQRKSEIEKLCCLTTAQPSQGLNTSISSARRALRRVSGRRFRNLGTYDDCTRECLAAAADVSLSGRRAARELDF